MLSRAVVKGVLLGLIPQGQAVPAKAEVCQNRIQAGAAASVSMPWRRMKQWRLARPDSRSTRTSGLPARLTRAFTSTNRTSRARASAYSRAACNGSATWQHGLAAHVAALTRDIEAAKKCYAPRASWSSESVGCFIQSVLQGAFIFAKARQGPEVVQENLAHLRRYLELLFKPARHHARETT
jgi:hypothetical protein